MRELRFGVPSRTSLLFTECFSLFSFFIFLIECRHGSGTTFPPLLSGVVSTVIPPLQSRIAVLLRTVRVSVTVGVSSLTECEQLTWLEGMRYLSVRARGGLTAARNPVVP